ncbi:SBBP repeat-containing protein [Spirosoma sp. BT702]|uniref:SBBP repeat-containing protein n=1 Tax=Spirosoma profusum TaxID=2771354 RepID=A0A926XU41_9BACT|nr:putative Ig domain-containing protein [Spirosoma profusum]MBD2700192.1 SBBP repeat-containing protein [Spirosoma profusum]
MNSFLRFRDALYWSDCFRICIGLLIWVGLTTAAYAQTFVWAKQMAGGFNSGKSIAVDGAGNVYTAGFFNGTVDFDPGPGDFSLTATDIDMYVSKLDVAGNLLWARRIGGPGSDAANSVVVDGSGNVYTTGHFSGTVDFDPGPGVFNLTAGGLEGAFVSKLDAAGNLVWAKALAGNGSVDGYSIAVDGSGNVHTTGVFSYTTDFDPGPGVYSLSAVTLANTPQNDDIFVSKLDALGNFVSAYRLGDTSNDFGYAIAVDGTGSVYATGIFSGTTDFDPGPGVNNLTSTGAMYITKLDASGNLAWVKLLEGGIAAFSIAVDGAGNAYTTGTLNGTVDFDPGSGVFDLTGTGGVKGFVSQLDAAGNFVWARNLGGIGYSISVDGLRNVYTTGRFRGTSDFDPGPGVYDLTEGGSSGGNIFISKLDISGNFARASSLVGAGFDTGNGIAVDKSGDVHTTGFFEGSADFDPGSGVFNLSAGGTYDTFVLKFNQLDVVARPTLVCVGSTVALSVTANGGTSPFSYTWIAPAGATLSATNTSAVSATLTAPGEQTFTVSVAGLGGPQSTTTVSVTATGSAVSITANPSLTITSGSSTTLTASGASSYSWSSGQNTAAISVSTAGPYSVTGTSGGCSSTTGVVVTVINTAPTITGFSANPAAVCVGNPVMFTASVGNVSGGYSYTLTDGSNPVTGTSTSNTFSQSLISSSTSGQNFTLTVNSNIQIAQATTTLTVSSLPTATLSVSPSSTLSCSQTSLTLTAGGGTSYTLSNGQSNTTGQFVINQPGTYSVIVANASGCTAIASVTVFQDSSIPTVTVTPASATLTCANSSTILSASGSGTFRWNTGAITSMISATSAGIYSVTLTAINGCTATTSVQVFQDNSVPAVSINPSSFTLTCTSPTASLSAVGNGTYHWNTGATTSSITATSAGAYSVTLTASSGCTATATAQVFQNTTIPSVSISPTSTTLTCANPTVSLTAVGDGTYRWNTGSTSQVISATSAGTYSVTLTDANGCTATTSVQVFQDNSVPSVSINPSSATLTCPSPAASLTATGNGTFRWNTGATSAIISVTAAGIYSVTLTSTSGCSASTSATVYLNNNVPNLTINPASATLTCTNSSVSLTAVGSGTYRWNTSAITPTISATSAGMYSVTLTAANGCTATASAQVFQNNSVPSVSISPGSATLTCVNPTASLTAVGSGTYRWNTGATSQVISVTGAGAYSVTLTGANGCTATFSAQVSQDNTPPSITVSVSPSLTINPGQSATLTTSGATTYRWNTGAITSTIVVSSEGVYSVTGTIGICSAQASVTISAPFAISAVISHSCQQIASNRYVISFTPQYSGRNGQPISFSIANEIFPTTNVGPYTLQLYDDNPTIILHAQQGGTPGEVNYTYNWLAICRNPQPNTPPRVDQPLTDQTARVGQEFGYTIPQTTFTDNESPQSLTLAVTGLPAGLGFTPPFQIGGIPNVAGVSSVTITATDPGGLTAVATFVLTVVDPSATNAPPTLANPVADQVTIQGQPFSLSLSNTFSDAQTPQTLMLTASGIPAGLTLVGTTLSGTPSVSGTSTISLTATDPGGLSATMTFGMTVLPSSATASAPFAITGVSPLTCTQIAANRYDISFNPRYSGLNGQPISFWVQDEMSPTTASGPYSLQLYTDNPTVVLKARQTGSAGEASFTYNWLSFCQNPQPNTPPRVNQPLTDQTAKVGEEFGYTIPQTTFTDNESPHSLSLTVSGLPTGMSFSPPVQIGGVPGSTGVSSVTVTGTDPQGLSVSTSFVLRVVGSGCRDTNGAITTVKSGSWSDPAVWSCGVVPTGSDGVQLNHAISLPAGYVAEVKTLRYGSGGGLTNQTGARLRLGF